MSRWDDFVETLKDKYPLMYRQALDNKSLVITEAEQKSSKKSTRRNAKS